MKHVPAMTLGLLLVLGATGPALAQSAAELARATDADYRQMLQQLGITRLRSGPSGDADAPEHANYDESLANPYPDYPDPLRLDDGTAVTRAAQWTTQRRPQLIADFEREVLGRVPPTPPGSPSPSAPPRTSASGRCRFPRRCWWAMSTTPATPRSAWISR